MTRKIKFRAWYVGKSKMLYQYDYEFRLSHHDIWRIYDYKATSDDVQTLLMTDKHGELMQYTGLKDKNGVEIYEGDIVKLNNEIFCVRYNPPMFAVFKNNEYEDSMYDSPLYEVIGNIYENLELLSNI